MKKTNFYTSVIVSSFLGVLGFGIILFYLFLPAIQNGGLIIINVNAYGEMWFEFIAISVIFIISVVVCCVNLIKIDGEMCYD